MTHSISLDKNFGALVVRFFGIIDFDEFLKVFQDLTDFQGFRPGLNAVFDCRDCTAPLSREEVKKLAQHAKGDDVKWGASKWAVIALSDVIFGQTRMFDTLTHQHQVQTQPFRLLQDADIWLGGGIDTAKLMAVTPT